MPELSKKDAEVLVDTLDKYGDILIGIGEIEKRVGSLKSWSVRFGKIALPELISICKKNPDFMTIMGAVLLKFVAISPKMEKISELSPKEKIEVGGTIKEISGLLKEVVKVE